MAGFGRKGLGTETKAPVNRPHNALAQRVKYDVTPNPLKMLLATVFFGVAALIFVKMLLDPRGLLINGLIKLSPGAADVFFAVLCLASGVMAALAVVGLFRSFGEKIFVTLDSHSITGPVSYNGTRVVRLDLSSISDVKITRMRDSEFVVIIATDGRKIKVGTANFRIASEWGSFRTELREKLGRARTNSI